MAVSTLMDIAIMLAVTVLGLIGLHFGVMYMVDKFCEESLLCEEYKKWEY